MRCALVPGPCPPAAGPWPLASARMRRAEAARSGEWAIEWAIEWALPPGPWPRAIEWDIEWAIEAAASRWATVESSSSRTGGCDWGDEEVPKPPSDACEGSYSGGTPAGGSEGGSSEASRSESWPSWQTGSCSSAHAAILAEAAAPRATAAGDASGRDGWLRLRGMHDEPPATVSESCMLLC